MTDLLNNPYRPGAGHPPPFLAGRNQEIEEFSKLLDQKVILSNCILTGLRGVGKTVLLEKFKDISIHKNWLWAGNELSESTGVSEDRMALRIMTDISYITSELIFDEHKAVSFGFNNEVEIYERRLDFETLELIYNTTPGLVSDKLKYILEISWKVINEKFPSANGVILGYDEAQTVGDSPKKEQYPLSLILDVFQSIQKKGIPIMLVLSGLPMIQSKLVESRTFSERMFKIIFLKKLNESDSREAITNPIRKTKSKVQFDEKSIELIIEKSGGYPYFIQFICKETFDIFLQQIQRGEKGSVPIDSIIKKLDEDFFAGRWGILTDRKRELLSIIAKLQNCNDEFSGQEVSNESKNYNIANFSNSQVNQLLSSLVSDGIIYKNRFGKYSFAVPQLAEFIRRQKILKE